MKTKIIFYSILFFVFAFLITNSIAQEDTKAGETEKSLALERLSVGDTNQDGRLDTSDLPPRKGDLAVSGNIGVGKKPGEEKIDVQGKVKTSEGFCIGEECKTSWPKFKCAEYSERPKGESGDKYCDSCGKTCTAVLLGSGSTSFNECSATPSFEHKVRCCWVE